MISTDFAPNEQLDDTLLSLSLLFQPWRWQKDKEINLVKEQICKMFLSNIKNQKSNIYFFLSGRSTLYHLLKSFNLSKNSEIIVQAFTCEAVILPIITAGYKPLYIDIEKETYSMDLEYLQKKINNCCRVLILQHTFGLTPKNRQRIFQFAKKNNLIIIEDLAHGFNQNIFTNNPASPARLAAKRASRQSPLATNYYLLSFGRSKSFSSVFGGAIISPKKINFPELKNPSYCFIFRCLLYKPIALIIKSTYDFYLGKIIHKIANLFGFLIPEISAREKRGKYDQLLDKTYPNALAILLLNQLKKYNKTQELRKKAAQYYNNQLSKIKYLSSNISLLRYPLLVNNRNILIKKGQKKNIFLGKWYDQVVAPKSLDLDRVYYQTGICPVAEKVCNQIINLPTNVAELEAKKIINFLSTSIN